MDLNWLEFTGRLTLYCFLVFVGGMLTAIVVRIWVQRRAPRSAIDALAREAVGGAAQGGLGRRVGRFFLEYVGNVSVDEPTMRLVERRRQRHARGLMDQVEQELIKRSVPWSEREKLMEELRETIRSERRFLESRGRDARAQEELLAAQRSSLAERISALLGDAPPTMVARIRAGLTAALGPPEIVGDQE